jgi:hypothetical protein
MKQGRIATLLIGAVAVAALFGFAATAQAFPNLTATCAGAGCHTGGPVPTITATPVSNNGLIAVYHIAVTGGTAGGPLAFAVFSGATRVDGNSPSPVASGNVSLMVGTTYTVFGISGPTNTTGVSSITVTPLAPAPDTTPPVTTAVPSVQSTYTGNASIHLVATDPGVGASGVGATYFTLNGSAVTTYTSNIMVSAPGAYTLEFWSVDHAGNTEATHTANFALVMNTRPVTTVLTIRSNVASILLRRRVILSGIMMPGDADDRVTLQFQRPGSRTWRFLATVAFSSVTGNSTGHWSFGYKPNARGLWHFRAHTPAEVGQTAGTSRTISFRVR